MQIPLFKPQTEWTPPTEFPNLSKYNEIAIDLETKDPDLIKMGSGSVTQRGQVVGIAVAVKGWKSIGNKVPPHKRMSAYEVIAKEIDKNNEDEVNSADIDIDNNDSDTLNLFE